MPMMRKSYLSYNTISYLSSIHINHSTTCYYVILVINCGNTCDVIIHSNDAVGDPLLPVGSV